MISWIRSRFFSSSDKNLDKAIKDNLEKYRRTYTLLEKYDRGEVSLPSSVAKSRDLRDYLQKFAKSN